VAEYEPLARQFNPTHFDAQVWGALLEEIGAEAFLITTKHHDGFCMYDTSLTDYKVTNTSFGRDPIGELAEACHHRGIQLHFYYSLLDWHHPDYRTNWPGYIEYYQGQLRELCTKYGPLGGILFDGYWPRFDFSPSTEYFKPGGKWDLAGTYDLIHSLQPNALMVNNHHVLPLKGEDYQVWELDLPGENTAGFNTTETGTLPFATWLNVNKGWSYFKQAQQEVKPVEQLVNYVIDSAARNATCWLNVGPTAEGEILAEEIERLRAAGDQLRERGVPARV
jgi:alpha-L-fucosidase